MKRRLLSILMVILMVFGMLPVTAGTVFAADADTLPPEVDAGSLRATLPEGKSEVTVGDQVTISARITDESGIRAVYYCYTFGDSSQEYQHLARYNEETDAYEIVIDITEDTPSGAARIRRINLQDVKGNIGNLWNSMNSGTDMADLSAGDFTVTGTDADTLPPEVDAGSLRVILPEGKSEVTVGDQVTISARITDESGIRAVYYCYTFGDSSQEYQHLARYNEETDAYEIVIDITEDTPSGAARIRRINLQDVKGNIGNLWNSMNSGADMADLSAGDFTVTSNCKVTFHTNGGSEVASQYVLAGEKASEPDEPTRSEYIFAGWYADEDLTEPFDFDTAINEDITVYAKWISAVTITVGVYDKTNSVSGQGGSYTFNNEDMTHTIGRHIAPLGSEITLTAAPSEGYQFEGWYLGRAAGDGDGMTVRLEGEVFNTEPVITTEAGPAFGTYALCAVFREINDTPPVIDISSLQIRLPEERQSDRAVTAGDTVNVSVKITDNGTITKALAYLLHDHENIPGDESYIAFKRVRLSKQDGDIWTGTLDIDENSDLGVWEFGYVEAVDDHNNRVGYYNSAGYYGEEFSPYLDLSAFDYSVEKGYTVTFNSNGGSEISSQRVIAGRKAAEPDPPVREGWHFNNWFTDEELTNQYWFGNAVNEDITLHAGWFTYMALGVYNKSNPDTWPYNYQCGTVDMVADTSAEWSRTDAGTMNFTAPEGNITFTAKPEEGYIFKGWYGGIVGSSHYVEGPSDELLSAEAEYTCASGEIAVCAVFECAGHQWEQQIRKATPDADGHICQACSVCGTEKDIELIPKADNISPERTVFAYTGGAIEPAVTVSAGSETLSADEYDVVYADNEKPGTASATVTLKGDYYEGSAVRNFRILFKDVLEGHQFFDPVYWAVDGGITTGWDDGTFRPWNTCNRAAVVTFLWRMAGKPAPKKMATFKDMPANTAANQDFRKAISWASEQGITTGYTGNVFKPWATCNRAAIITFIWRYAGKPSAGSTAKFNDMPANTKSNQDFRNAISWGSANGIAGGWSDNTFRPWKDCNRASMVTFLYRQHTKQ